jgi:hypothetical protein
MLTAIVASICGGTMAGIWVMAIHELRKPANPNPKQEK